MKRFIAAAAACACLVTAGASSPRAGAGGSAAPTASASAWGVRAPGGSTATISAPPDAVQYVGGFSAGGVSTGPISANASSSTAAGRATASASVEVSGITLFGGEVTIGQVVARANVSAQNGRASGDTSGSYVSGITLNGAPVGSGGTAQLGDWGFTSGPSGGGSPTANGYRASVTGLTITLTAEHGGLPAGSQIVIGYAEASAAAPPAPPPPPPVTTTEPPPAPPPPPPRRTERPPPPPPLILPPPPGVKVKIGRSGYVFPVYGPASFSNTFRAARATTGWHHGEDIFAPYGAPILAVADGTVFSVGWNDVGGNRFWLKDKFGNEFYYAHLAAFSPLAVNGAQVRAGDVIGFMGNTGDAQGTPPHLHFEIHPAELLDQGYDGVIPPYPWLIAVQNNEVPVLRITAAGALSGVGAPSNAPPPGAYMLSSSDISETSGLDAGSLRRALVRSSTAGPRADDAPRDGERASAP